MEVRINLWHTAAAIAICACSFALIGPLESLGVVAVAVAVLGPIVLAARPGRLRAAAFAFSVYPAMFFGSLYATWFAAWCVLGRPPRASVDDPKFISWLVLPPYVATRTLLLGFPLALLLCVLAGGAHLVLGFQPDRTRLLPLAAPLLLGIVLWLALALIVHWDLLDFGRKFGWFMD